MPSVELFHWNPVISLRRRTLVPWLLRKRVDNFGDLLGPVVAKLVLARKGIDVAGAVRPARLLSVGSVLSFARDGDTIWGTGRNGKVPESEHTFRALDVRAVRGPLTRQFLEDRGIATPEVFGDPALLLPLLDSRLGAWTATKTHEVTIVPNLYDFDQYAGLDNVVDPCAPLGQVLRRIAQSHFVIASSLHALVVAESLGIPAQLLRSGVEPDLKYQDYYLGTGRPDVEVANSLAEALRIGGAPKAEWSDEALLASFPSDLWGSPVGAASGRQRPDRAVSDVATRLAK
jgi:pyruvyltransferase